MGDSPKGERVIFGKNRREQILEIRVKLISPFSGQSQKSYLVKRSKAHARIL
jgi:hypothetical protein